MEFTNTFLVPLPPDEAFRTLTELERVAPCMPGATLHASDGRSYQGEVRVKVGPMTLTYHGTAEMVEVEEAERSAVIEARGREKRGSSTAAATVRARLEDGEEGTRVTVTTNLDITGKPAQFGRGVMADIGAQLIETFAQNLARSLTNAVRNDHSIPNGHDGATIPVVPRTASASETVLDLGRVGGQVVARRVAPVLAGLAVLVFFWWRHRRQASKTTSRRHQAR